MKNTISPEILQPIFDKVAAHFLTMTHPSSSKQFLLNIHTYHHALTSKHLGHFVYQIGILQGNPT